MNLGNLIAGVSIIVFMIPGAVMGTMGYKLWKYTIFILGFLQGAAIGAFLGVALSAASAGDHGNNAERLYRLRPQCVNS